MLLVGARCKLGWCEPRQGSSVVAWCCIDAPGFDALAGLGETDEQVLVEALAQPAR